MLAALLTGLSIGGIYVLVALGYDIVLIASGIFNFAQAAVVMLGTYLAYHYGVQDQLGIGYVILISAAIGALVGIATEIVAIRPILGKEMHGELVTTIGVTSLIQGIAILIWDTDARPVRHLISGKILTFGDARISADAVALIAIAVLSGLALWMWSRFTLGGIASLAAAEDRQAATLRGVNVNKLSILALAASGAFGGAAGPVIGPTTFATVTLGAAVTIKAFVGLSIGGFGSFPGAVIGGFLVGIVESLVSRYVGGQYALLSLFVLLLAVLMVLPNGLFGRRVERAV